nr:unnamed protein product [Homo sapiens]
MWSGRDTCPLKNSALDSKTSLAPARAPTGSAEGSHCPLSGYLLPPASQLWRRRMLRRRRRSLPSWSSWGVQCRLGSQHPGACSKPGQVTQDARRRPEGLAGEGGPQEAAQEIRLLLLITCPVLGRMDTHGVSCPSAPVLCSWTATTQRTSLEVQENPSQLRTRIPEQGRITSAFHTPKEGFAE